MARASNDGRAMCSTFTCPDRDGLIRVIGRFLVHFIVIVILRDHPQYALAQAGARHGDVGEGERFGLGAVRTGSAAAARGGTG
jgi:hypothetical protein